MSFLKQRATKIYDDNATQRQKTFRYLQDNVETFLDYPENKVYMIDREDLQVFDYLNGPFETRCSRIGLVTSMALGSFCMFKFRKGIKIMLVPLTFFPVPVSYAYSYSKLAEFLDYCEVKYKDRGLHDTDLWNYHKQNSKLRFLPK